MQVLFMAHSGLRYLVLLAGFAALLYFISVVASKGGSERTARVVGSAYAGLIDLQLVLGFVMVAFGLFYPALIGHLFMMVAAAVVAHIAMLMGRKTDDLPRANGIRLLGVIASLVLIVGGIMAIGRGVLSSGAPSLVF